MQQLWKPYLTNLIAIRDFLAVFANTYLFYSSFVLLLTIVIFLVFKNYAMHLLISFGKLPYKELNHVIQKRNLCNVISLNNIVWN